MKILQARFPSIRVHNDIRTLRKLDPGVELMTGGFPCPDISSAGNQQGLRSADGKPTRSGLFYEMIRVARSNQVPLLFLENVSAITSTPMKATFHEVSSFQNLQEK